MYLNLFHHHLMYISDFDSYAKKFLCKTCHRHFNNITNAKRHQRTCKGRTKRRFPGGFYSSPRTIFDRLEQYSIVIPESQRFYEWFLVYDLESMLVPLNTQDTSNLQYTESHVPIPLVFVLTCRDTLIPSVLLIRMSMLSLGKYSNT